MSSIENTEVYVGDQVLHREYSSNEMEFECKNIFPIL